MKNRNTEIQPSAANAGVQALPAPQAAQFTLSQTVLSFLVCLLTCCFKPNQRYQNLNIDFTLIQTQTGKRTDQWDSVLSLQQNIYHPEDGKKLLPSSNLRYLFRKWLPFSVLPFF